MRRLACLGCALLLEGCVLPMSKLPAPMPTATQTLQVGVNADFEGSESADTLARIEAVGPGTVIRSTVADVSEVPGILAGAATHDVRLLLLLANEFPLAHVEALGHLLVAAPQVIGVEVRNETDLGVMPADQFGHEVQQAYRSLRAAGWTGRVWAGGLSSVRPEKLGYWQTAAIYMDGEIGMAVHRYADGDGTPGSPQRGWLNRMAEIMMVNAAAGQRPVMVSEFGYCYTTVNLSEEMQVADWLDQDLRWFAVAGWSPALVYQITDGPRTDCLDRYGLHDQTGRYRQAYQVLTRWGHRGVTP